MALTIDGASKLLTLDTATAFNFHDDVYVPAIDWSCLSTNMQYVMPVSGSGKISLGSSVFTDAIYSLLNGWKIKPSGYSASDQITVTGTLVTDDSTARTVAPTTGSNPVWVFQVATDATIVATGSGVTSQDKIDIAALVDANGYLTEDNFLALK